MIKEQKKLHVSVKKCKFSLRIILITLKTETMQLQSKVLDFTGTTIFCALDVHKKNWSVNIQDAELSLESFSQDPDPVLLYKHLKRKYPGANFKIAYEAGFCGFDLQRKLTELGLECIVVNPADIPTTNKEKTQKNDKSDARRLCNNMKDNKVTGIYIPDYGMESDRRLVRCRTKLVTDQTRVKNRIKHLLMNHSIKLSETFTGSANWSNKYITELKKLDCGHKRLRIALDIEIVQLENIKASIVKNTLAIREMCREAEY